MSGQTFSTFTEVGMIDARLKTGIITLPTTTSIPYRILTLKDVYGATSFSTVTISTQTGDAFEDGTTTRSINAAWGMTTLYAGKAGTWYTIGGSILTTASISSLTISSIFGLNNLVSTSYLATQLGSTVIGLGTAGYLSSIPSLGGFVSTANLANLVSTANLTGLVSTANLVNLVSTANLVNLVSTANLVNLVSTANLTNLVSTANLANHISTANLANLVSTTYLATQLGSTVRGLGTAGYLSSINYSTVVLSSLTAQNLTSVQGYISSLTVDSLLLGSNSAFVDMGDVIATSLSTIQINVGTQFAVTISAQQLFVSSIQATNIIGALTNANLTSTVIGLGTAGYLSSAITNVGGFGFISTANLANLVSTANLAGHISTANLANLVSTTYLATQLGSTIIGLGTAGYLSTIIFGPIVSTHNLANLVSTANLANLVSTANLVNLVSTANLANLVSTSYLQTQLGSTVIGLGTAGYISSSQLLSTSAGLNQYISSFIDPVELTSTVIGLGTEGFVSSLGLTYAVASTAQGLGTFGYTSTSQLLSTSLGLYQEIQNSPANIKQSNVTSTIIGLGTFGYLSTVVFGSVVSTANLANLVSTANLTNLVSTANLVNFVSTANIANLVSTTYLATQLGSTVRGLGTAGYLSSINYSTVVLSSLTAQNLTSVQGYISSLVVDSLQLGSNTAYIYMGDVIATSLSTVYVAAGSATIISLSSQQLYVSSIQATNIIGALTTANLTSTVIGLGTVGYISTGLGGFSFVSTANLANFVSTANLANLVSTANLTNHVSTANLANLVSTANIANFISTANLANFVSTANIANLVSTTYLATQLGSTVIGLGTAGYISSAQLLSTTFGYSQNFTTQNASISSLRFSTATANNAYISSLNIDQLTFGDGNGWADFGVLRALAISTLVVNTGILYATTVSTSQLIGVNFLVQSNLTSTVIGLGTAGYLSSVTATNLSNLVSTANLANLVSTANLANLVSTNYLASQLTSTVIGLGTIGYLSTSTPFNGSTNQLSAGTILVSSINAVTITTSNLTVNSYETVNYNGGSNIISYGSGIDTLSLKSPLTQYNGGIASLFFGTGTAGYPLARLSAVDQGTSYATSALIFQTATRAVNSNLSGISQFEYTSVNQTFTVPSGVTSISIQLWGAGGGRAGSGGQGSGGAGAYVTGNLTVIPGGTYAIIVGQAGQQGSTATTYGGGGAGNAYGSSGGGRSAIQYVLPVTITAASANGSAISYTTSGAHGLFVGAIVVITNLNTAAFNVTGLVATFTTNAFTINNTATGSAVTGGSGIINQELVTVGGGGGGGYQGSGELGGYASYSGTAGAGQTALSLSPGQGGTQSAGGAGGSGAPSGGLLYGASSGINGAGGGGGGYYAGGTGGNVAAGGGGSSYTSNSLFTLVSGANSPNLSTQAPGTASSSYIAGVAVGGTSSSGGPGLVVISAAVSYSLAESMRINNIGYLGIGTAAPQALLHVSGMTYSMQMSTQSITISSINGATLGGILASTVTGLGTVGYISSAQLVGHVSTANLANLVSTANLANLVSTANLANLVSTTYLATQLNSTVRGLGTSGYLSTINYSTVVLSSLTAQNLTSVQGYISSLTVDAFYLGSNSAFFNMGDVIATSLSTIQINVGTQFAVSISAQQLYVSSIQATNIIGALVGENLTSTVIGLGSAGYISSSQLLSTSAGLSQYISSFIDPTELTSTVIGLGTAGFVSSLGLTYAVASTAQGLGTFGYTSTSQLLSTSLGLYQEIQNSPVNIKQSNVTSTIIGLGTFGYLSTVVFGSIISTANLANLVSTANLANLVSTANLANLVSTANLAGHISTANLANLISTTYLSTQLGSTFAVLNVSSFSTFSFTGTTGFISTLTVNNLFIGSNQGFTTMGDVIGTSLSTILLYTGVEYATNIYASSLAVSSIQSYSNQVNILSAQQVYVSSIQATNIIGALTTANLTSTVIGLGTAGYISSIPSIGGFVSTANLANLVSTANLANLVSTANLANLVSTANLANLVSTANLANLVSTANLANLVSTANLANLVSTANLANLVSTSYLATQIGSTVIGLGTAGYVSSSQLLSTSFGLNLFISTFYVDHPELLSTVAGLGTLGYLSTGFSTSISRNFLTSSLSTVNINTANVNSLTATISSLTVNALFIGTGTGFTDTGDTIGTSMSTITITANSITAITLSTQQLNVSSITGISLISQTNLTSTVIGLGTTGYVSSSQLVSTSAGLSQYISSFIDPTELTSTVIGLGTAGFVSSLGLTYAVASTAQGLGTFGYTSTSQLLSTSLGLYQEIQNSPVNIKQSNVTSTIIGLGTFGYLSTVVFGSIVSTANLANLVSTANLANLVSTANLANLVSTANLANLVSTANLANLVSTANLANLVSTANLANHISTANLANFVSTTYLSTQLGSTFATLNVSSLSTFSLQGTTAFISSLTVNGLFIGSNQGFVNMGDVIATSVSSLVVYAGGMFSTSNSSQQTFLSSINGVSFANIGSGGIAGIPSSLNTSSISTFSLTGTTAFISSLTVNGLFIGSNQGFVNMGDIIATSLSSLVIYTGSAFATSNQASITSTQQLNISSINGQTFGGPITSTVIGLGTTGYLSTIVFGSIVSTANLANHISTANLANLVSTANLANLVSTANLANHISTANLANLVSTTYIATQLGSTVIGLGTVGYISSAQFLSSFNGISLNFRTSSINTNNLSAGTTYVSSMVINTLQIGLTPGFIQMGDIITTSVSTILTTTNLLNAGINAISSFNVYGGTNQSGLGLRFFGSSIQSPLGQPASMSVSSVSTYTTMYLGTFDQYAPGRGASLGFGANNSNGLQTLQGRITGTPTTYTLGGADQGTLNFDVNASGQMYNVMTMWAIGGQPTGRVGINCNSPSFNLDVNGTMRVSSTTTFSSNVLLTGGVTSFMSNSGLFSNVATATFASNVLHTGGLTSFMSNSGLFSNVGQATFTGGVNIVASALTASNSSSPVIFSNATSAANSVIKCEMGGANFIIRQAVNAGSAAVIENTGGGALLINPLGASVSIGSSNNSYMLDVAGIARSGIPVSSLTGTSATFGANAFGIYYYITNSAFSNIGLYNTSGGATGTGGTAPPIGTGWYVTLRNNTGSYLSITVNGLLVSTPASPFTIPPSNSVTIAYDANLAGGAGYVFF